MRHFDAWLVRDPYSIWHYYPTGQRWQDTVRNLIHERAICAAPIDIIQCTTTSTTSPDALPIDITTQSPQISPLLTNLPPEIRSIIWSYVFGTSTLHLVQIKNKIKHVRCSSDISTTPTDTTNNNINNSLTHHRHCCPLTPARWRIYDGRVPGHTDRLLYPHTHSELPHNLSTAPGTNLLQTCKALYIETSHLLYKNNLLDTDDLSTFLSFATTLSPHTRNAITRLTIHWTPIWTPLSGQEHTGSIYAHTHSDALWLDFWHCVANLRGLRELNLSIDLGRFTGTVVGGGPVLLEAVQGRLPLDIGEDWVRPLLRVRGLKGFDLAVTARCDVISKGVLEEGLLRRVEALREGLRGVMMGERVEGKEKGEGGEDRCGRVDESESGSGMRRRRLAIMPA